MKTMRHLLCFAVFSLAAFCTFAQTNPYPEENDEYAYAVTVKYQGQKPIITDFINAFFGEESEDELTGYLSDLWHRYLKNEPLDKNEKVTVDTKNGFACFEKVYPPEEDYKGGKMLVEMCYWNCSDGNHKIYAESVQYFDAGRAVETEFSGIVFGIYNNATHKMTYTYQDDMGARVTTGMENLGVTEEKGAYYLVNYETEERKPITEEQYNNWWNEYPVVTYSLPRVGKDITAVINNRPEGKKEIVVKWNGLRFDVQQ